MHTQTFTIAERRLLFFRELPDAVRDRNEAERKNVERTKQEIHGELKKLQESLPKIENIQYREDGLLTSFNFQGRQINCSEYPLNKGHLENTLRNIEKAFQNLNEQKDVVSLVNEQTIFHLIDGYRIECTVKKDDRDISYVATPRELLRIVKTHVDFTTEEEKRQIPDLRRRSRLLYIKAGQGEPETEEERKIHNEGNKMDEKEWTATMSKAGDLRVEADEIESRMNGRLLRNDTSGIGVREYQHPDSFFKGHFVRQRTLPDGITQREDFKNRLMEIEFLQKGQVQNSDVYDERGLRIARHTYRDGKLVETDHYAMREGKEVITHRTLHLPEPSVLFPIPQENQTITYFNPFGPEVTALQLAQLIASIDSKEKYDLFEEVYWNKFSSHLFEHERTVRDAASRRGMELYGVARYIEELEKNMSKHSINFHLKLEPDFNTRESGTRAKLRNIALSLPEITDAIQKYPSQYLRNHKLRNVYVLGSLRMDIPGLENPAGFYNPESGLMALTPGQELRIATILHHEYHHGADDIDGGLREDNADWIRRFHGDGKLPNGENVYGESRIEVDGWRMPKADTGFARAYGRFSRDKTSPSCDEDQATIAEKLFHQHSLKKLYKKAENDPVLQEKIAHMQRWYLLRSEGRMDAQYFQDIIDEITIDGAYWDRREKNGDFNSNEVRKFEQYMQFERTMHSRKDELERLRKETFYEQDVKKREHKLREYVAIYKDASSKNPYNESYVHSIDGALDRLSEIDKNIHVEQELIPVLESQLERLPKTDREPSHYVRLAKAYTETGQVQKAKELYEAAIKQFPRDFTLGREYVALLRKTSPDAPNSDLVTTLLEQIYKRSGQRKDCVELINAYSARGEEEKLINVTKGFYESYPDDEGMRKLYEEKMITMGKTNEVISFYEQEIKKTPERALTFGIILANFYAYGAKDHEKAKAAFTALIEKAPGNIAVQNALIEFTGGRMQNANKERKNNLYRETAQLLRTSWVTANDAKAAEGYTDFALKYGSYEEAKEAYVAVREHFQESFQVEIHRVTDKEFMKSFRKNHSSLRRLVKEQGTLDEYVQVCRDFLAIAGEQPDLNQLEERFAFSALVLFYEKNDIDKAIELCKQFVDDKRLHDYNQESIQRQYYYLLARKASNKWIKVPQSDAEYAFVAEEGGVLYIHSGNSYVRRERWVEGSKRPSDFLWDNASSRTKYLKKEDLPEVLKD